MPERIEKLRATLTELESELETLPASEIDDETRTLLDEAVGDIQAALSRQPEALEPHSLAQRLEVAAKRFESSHPALFVVASRTIDALSRMGL